MSVSTQAEAKAKIIAIPLDGLDCEGPLSAVPMPRQSLRNRWLDTARLRAAVREPLVHFLLAGATLLALSNMFRNAGSSSQNRIEVSAAEIGRLCDIWTRQWGHAPDSRQLDNLVADYVREEIYYREARASGLDKDDTIIRRRLVEKMEFLSQEIAFGEPSDPELEQFFAANRQKYSLPAQAGFSHIYFSTARRGEATLNDARAELARLRSNQLARTGPSVLAGRLGDGFMLQSEYPPQTGEQIANLFGDEFAARVLQLQPGVWNGPVRSSYGWHLVCVTEYIPPREASLGEVRNQVAIDYKNQRLQTASDRYYARLRERYKVEIDQKALAVAKAQAAQPGNAQPSTNVDGGTPADLD